MRAKARIFVSVHPDFQPVDVTSDLDDAAYSSSSNSSSSGRSPISVSIGTPGWDLDVRIARADLTWLTLGALVSLVVRKRWYESQSSATIFSRKSVSPA